MPVDTHDPNLDENFRLLIEQSFGGELSREDETALRSHLESCAACHQYKITVSQIASALGGFAFESTLEQTAHVPSARFSHSRTRSKALNRNAASAHSFRSLHLYSFSRLVGRLAVVGFLRNSAARLKPSN